MNRVLRRLARLEMNVPDVATTGQFLISGLGFAPTGDDGFLVQAHYGQSGSEEVIRLHEGNETAIGRVVFEVIDHDALSRVKTSLSAGGHDFEEAETGISVVDPSGIPLHLRLPEVPGPILDPSPLRPRRLGHVNIAVPDAPDSGRFYTDVLRLAVSEAVGELLLFLRVGSEHHNVGFRSGADRIGLHHVAFEVGGWDAYRAMCDHLAETGYLVEYGPGRHGPGNNLFIYVVDPSSGLRLELFSDMAHVPEDHEPLTWESVDRVRTVNLWGPQPPQSFLK